MTRVAQITPDSADPDQRALLEETERQLGRLPNLYATLAASPAALSGYLALRDALTHGVLSQRLREKLALLVASDNNCGYCVAAHVFRGRRMRFTEQELAAVRRADSADRHEAAVLRLARRVLADGGRVPDRELASARADGVSDAELAELTAHVALNVLSNHWNHLARPDLDFPDPDEPSQAAA